MDNLGYFTDNRTETALQLMSNYKAFLLQGSASGVVYASLYLVASVINDYATAVLKYDNRTIKVTLNISTNEITTSERTSMNVQVFGVK